MAREPIPREHPVTVRTREYHKTRVTALTKILPDLMARVSDPDFPLDELNPLEIAAREFRAGLLQDLGGATACSHAQLATVSTLTTSWILLGSIDAYLLELAAKPIRGLLDRKKRRLASAVEQRMAMADSFLRQLRLLGIEKASMPVPTIDEVIRAQREAQGIDDTSTTNGNGHA